MKKRKSPKNEEIFIRENFELEIGGTIWTIPRMKFVRDEAGNLTFSYEDFLRYQQAVSIQICAEDRELTISEFELLCSVTLTKITDIAKVLRISHSTISKWSTLKPNQDPRTKKISYADSFVLRVFFLGELANENERRRDIFEGWSKRLFDTKKLPAVMRYSA